MYKLAIIYSPDLFTHLNISDKILLDDLSQVYKNNFKLDFQIFDSTKFKDVNEFNTQIENFSAIQIMCHGDVGVAFFNFIGKDQYHYNELFSQTGIKFTNQILFLNICHSGDMTTFSQGIDICKPSFAIGYSNKMKYVGATKNVLGNTHRDLSAYFLKKNVSKITQEMYDELFETLLIYSFTESYHDKEFPGQKRNSSDDPGFSFMSSTC